MRRLQLDVDKAVQRPGIDLPALVAVIENAGAAMHSIDEIVVGERIIERVPRAR